MKQLHKIQEALIKKNNNNLLSSIEKDIKNYNALKKEYNNLKQKNNLKSISKQFIVYFFLNAITHDDINFASTLKDYHKIEEIDNRGTKIALGRFFYLTNYHKKAIDYFLPLFDDDTKLDFIDLHRLFTSLSNMAMHTEVEKVLQYALNVYNDSDLWKFEALKYQINTSHIYPKNKENIISNLNYMSKVVKDKSGYMYMGYNFYNAGYYQQSFNMYDKYFTIVDTEVEIKENKHIFNSQNTLDSMDEIIDLLDDIDVKSFPVFGSLLGLVRDGKFFDHDKDADIGLFVNSYDEIYKIVSYLCRLDKFSAPSIVSNSKENAMWNVAIFDISRNTAIDLFFFYKKENHYETGVNTKCGTLKWQFTPFELERETLAGREYWVPTDYEYHLEESYGNWRETVVVWESLLNCPNLSKDSQIGVIYYALQKLAKAIETRSLQKFNNIYNNLTTRWNYRFSEAADTNLQKIKKELETMEQSK